MFVATLTQLLLASSFACTWRQMSTRPTLWRLRRIPSSTRCPSAAATTNGRSSWTAKASIGKTPSRPGCVPHPARQTCTPAVPPVSMDGFACWGTSTLQMTYHVLFIQHTETVQTYTVQMELTETRAWV